MTLTPAEADGPLLVTVTVKTMLVPTTGVALDAVLVTARSATGTGTGVLVAVLLPGVGSVEVDVAVAVFAYGPVGSTVAVICKVAFALAANVPIGHTPVPAL